MEGLIFAYIVIIIVFLIIQYVVAKKFEKIAFQKGYDEEIHSFAMCFWLGIIGMLYVIALPDKTSGHVKSAPRVKAARRDEEPSEEPEPIVEPVAFFCPVCNAPITHGMEKCPSCRQPFDWS